MVPVGPTADCAASYSAMQLRRGPRTAHGPSWSRGRRCPAEHAAWCRSCGVADGVVNQVGPSGTAHGSSELVKAHTPRRGRHSCRNTLLPLSLFESKDSTSLPPLSLPRSASVAIRRFRSDPSAHGSVRAAPAAAAMSPRAVCGAVTRMAGRAVTRRES
jgi:hypothetical protein